jgi:uncharacterized protein (TIGR02231 family)
MRAVFLIFLISFGLILPPVFAAPHKVILYPAGATIFARTSVPPQSESFTLQLPQVALPESLQLKLLAPAVEQRFAGIEYQSVLPEIPDYPQLKERIAQLERKLGATQDQVQAHELALNFWRKAEKLPLNSLADAQTAGQLIRTESSGLLKEISALNQTKAELEKQLQEARRQLEQKTGDQQRQWQVQVRLSHPSTPNLEVSYAYRIRQAGWQSSYVLNGLPQENRVDWLWTARINQQTGQDWSDVVLKLVTAEPVFTLDPPKLQPWEIDELRVLHRNGALKTSAAPRVSTLARTADDAAETAAPPPVRTQGQLFDSYDLGRITVLSGTESRVKIREGSWPASFSYLARPQLSEQVFLEGKLDLTAGFLPLPNGPASIQLEGVHVGRRSFSLHAKQDVTLSFGSDPGIAVDVQTDHQAGEKGLLAKKSTYRWNWTINFTNNKDFPVQLQIEDSYPHTGHEDIELTEVFSPPLPTRADDRTLNWDLTLPAHASKQVQYGYKLKYPEDMDVALGR